MLPTPHIAHLNENVYEPAEDSFLLLDTLEHDKDWICQRLGTQVPLVIEVGTGSGVITSFIISNIIPKSLCLTTDINPYAIRQCVSTIKHNNSNFGGFDSLQMDLTHGIIPKSIDLLVFNPPYVPGEDVPKIPNSPDSTRWVDLALVGGVDGMIVTWKLLDMLNVILSNDGVAYILFCARNKPEDVKTVMETKGWFVDIVLKRKAGWEVLTVLKFYRS